MVLHVVRVKDLMNENQSANDVAGRGSLRCVGDAGMNDAGSLPENVTVPGRVQGYTQKDGKWVLNTDTLPWRGTPAGGGYSTLTDLLRFAHAMMDGARKGGVQQQETRHPRRGRARRVQAPVGVIPGRRAE